MIVSGSGMSIVPLSQIILASPECRAALQYRRFVPLSLGANFGSMQGSISIIGKRRKFDVYKKELGQLECGSLSVCRLSTMATHTVQVVIGKRFAFGENWTWFPPALHEERVHTGCESLAARLGRKSLPGGGISNLAARRMQQLFDFNREKGFLRDA